MRNPSVRCGLSVRVFVGALFLLLSVPVASAQVCQDASDTFWKVDTLPDVPVGVPLSSQVIVALCEGEAAGSIFTPPMGMGPQYVKQVSIGLGHTGGDIGHQFILSVEVYENPTLFGGAILSIGTKVFDLLADAGTTLTGTSSGMNTFDLRAHNIVVDGTFIVAFRVVANVSFPGCPGAVPGSAANVLTDGTGQCVPGLSVLDERTAGWVDPTVWQFAAGQPICPSFYSGNWAVRACTTDAGTWEDLGGGTVGINGPVSLVGSGPLTAGTFNPITLTNAAPSAAMIAWISLNPTPFMAIGGTVHAFPFNAQLFLFSNAAGGFSAASSWPPGVPPGTQIYFQFLVEDASSIHGITMSNGIRGTTP